MKLELIGHDEKYAVEQSLLTLFPDERPVYGPVTDEDASAARITLTEDADSVCVTTELRCGGKAAAEEAECNTYSPRLIRIIRRCSAVQFPYGGFLRFPHKARCLKMQSAVFCMHAVIFFNTSGNGIPRRTPAYGAFPAHKKRRAHTGVRPPLPFRAFPSVSGRAYNRGGLPRRWPPA